MIRCPRCKKMVMRIYFKGVCVNCYNESDGCCKDYTKS